MHLDCNENQFFIDVNSYKIDEYENICSNNSTWFSLKNDKKNRNNRMNMFKINEGDVLKIGKIIIRIRKIKFQSNKHNDKKINIDINDNKYELSNSATSEKISILKEIGANSLFNFNNNINIQNTVKKQNEEEEKEKEKKLVRKN